MPPFLPGMKLRGSGRQIPSVRVPGLGRIHPGLLLLYIAICLATVGLVIDGPRLMASLAPHAADSPVGQVGLHGAPVRDAATGDEAVPAMAPAKVSSDAAPTSITTAAPAGDQSATSDAADSPWHKLQKQVFKEIIDNTIPLIGLEQSGRPTSERDLLEQAAGYFLGFQPTDPLSLLRAGLPLLEQVELATGDGDDGSTPVVEPATPSTPSTPSQPQTPPAMGTDPLVLGAKIEVAIYSTHSSEAFLPDLVASGHPYQPNVYTSDVQLNIIRVGEELARELYSRYGLGTVQIRTLHDAEGYLGAYTRSQTTVQNLLKAYPNLRLIIDLHRDSSARKDTVLKVDGKDVARVMLIIGTGGRLRQPNWQKNYAVAKSLVAEIERLYPGLSRGVVTKADRYNQHLSTNAILIELGGLENSLEEELRTARMLAKAISGMLNGAGAQTAETKGGP